MARWVRGMVIASWLAGWLGPATTEAQTQAVGPFTVEAVERRVGAGGFPNRSGNPFQRVKVTWFRVLHRGKQVPPPGTEPDRGAAAWTDARVLADAPQPALLLMGSGAFLLTDADGQPRLHELAPRNSSRTTWQWLDASQGQPGPVQVVALTH